MKEYPEVKVYRFKEREFLGIKLICPICRWDYVHLIQGELSAYSVMYRLIPSDMQRIEKHRRHSAFDPRPPKTKFQCGRCNIEWSYDEMLDLIEDAVKAYLTKEAKDEQKKCCPYTTVVYYTNEGDEK